MLEPLTIGLVAAALAEDGDAAAAAAEDYRDRPGYPGPVAGLATTFWNALEGELREVGGARPETIPCDGSADDSEGSAGNSEGSADDSDGSAGDSDGSAEDGGSADDSEGSAGDAGVDWAAVPRELSAVDPAMRDELDGVERVVDALAGVEGLDPGDDPELERELGAAVVAAYRGTVAGAGTLAGTDLADRIGLGDDDRLRAAVDDATRRLGRLAEGFRRRGPFELVDAEGNLGDALRRHVGCPSPAFVDRPELAGLPASPDLGRGSVGAGDATVGDPGTGPAAETTLLVGPAGAGKSRAVAELVARLADSETVDGVLFPTGRLRHPADLDGIRSRSFGGDLVLAWDDAHAASPGTGNGVVLDAIREVSAALGEDGHRPRAVLSADDGAVDALPGPLGSPPDAAVTDADGDPSVDPGPDPASPDPSVDPGSPASPDTPGDPGSPGDSGLQGDPPGVDPVELGGTDAETLTAVTRAALDHHGVAAGDGAVAALVDRAREVDPTPLYVESAVATAGRELTVEDVAALPGDATAVWRRAYDRLGEGTDPTAPRRVLRSLAVLAAAGVSAPHRSRLVEGVHEHVLGGHPDAFVDAVRTLVAGGWIEVVDAGDAAVPDAGGVTVPGDAAAPDAGEGTDPGDSPVPGAGEGTDPGARRVDAPDAGDREAPDGIDWHREGPVGLGVAYRVHGAKLDAVPLDADRHLPALSAFLLSHLDRYRRPPDPRLDRVLPPGDPRRERALHDRVATALAADGRGDLAERHFARLVEGVDPDGRLPCFEYTLLLTETGGRPAAADGEEPGSRDPDPPDTGDAGPDTGDAGPDAGDAGPDTGDAGPDAEFAGPHHEYATRLVAAGEHTGAAAHFERALAIDPDHVGANHEYASLLAGAGDDRAGHHFERALEGAPGDARIHRDYGNYLAGRDDAAAAAHYERATEIDPAFADAHYDHGTLRYGQGDPEEAAVHYERAIEADPDHPRARYNLALVRRAEGDGAAALDHLDRAVAAWVDRDRPDNAVENLATRVEVLLDRGRVGAAREECERGRGLIDRGDLSPNDYAVRWIESEALRLDAVADPPTDAAGDPDLPALYRMALLHQVAGDDRRALHLLATLWDARGTVDPGVTDPGADPGETASVDPDPGPGVDPDPDPTGEGSPDVPDELRTPDSTAGPHEATLAAGVALAGHLRTMERPGVDRPEGILARIEVGTDVDLDPGAILDGVAPHRGTLSDPVRAVHDHLDAGATGASPAALRDLAAGELPEDLGRPTLEPHVFATLLDSLVGDPGTDPSVEGGR